MCILITNLHSDYTGEYDKFKNIFIVYDIDKKEIISKSKDLSVGIAGEAYSFLTYDENNLVFYYSGFNSPNSNIIINDIFNLYSKPNEYYETNDIGDRSNFTICNGILASERFTGGINSNGIYFPKVSIDQYGYKFYNSYSYIENSIVESNGKKYDYRGVLNTTDVNCEFIVLMYSNNRSSTDKAIKIFKYDTSSDKLIELSGLISAIRPGNKPGNNYDIGLGYSYCSDDRYIYIISSGWSSLCIGRIDMLASEYSYEFLGISDPGVKVTPNGIETSVDGDFIYIHTDFRLDNALIKFNLNTKEFSKILIDELYDSYYIFTSQSS